MIFLDFTETHLETLERCTRELMGCSLSQAALVESEEQGWATGRKWAKIASEIPYQLFKLDEC